METCIALGTGMAMTKKAYTTSFLLQSDNKPHLLLDTGGGNGLLSQLEKAAVDPNTIDHIFISHTHSDHLLGAPWLVRAALRDLARNRRAPLFFYGASPVMEALKALLYLVIDPQTLALHIGRTIHLVSLSPQHAYTIAGRRCVPFHLEAKKCLQYGLHIELDSGLYLAFCGDEPLSATAYLYQLPVDILMHEAFCTEDERAIYHPERIAHSTAREAGAIAENLQAKSLILFHMGDAHPTRKESYIRDAKKSFHGKIYAPDDLDRIPLEIPS